MIFKGSLNEYLLIKEINSNGCYLQNETFENSLTFLWFDKESNFISVDGVDYNYFFYGLIKKVILFPLMV